MSESQHPVAAVGQDNSPLPYLKILIVGILTLSIFGASILWSTHILNATVQDMNPNGPAPIPAQVYQKEVGIVNQRMFALDQRASEKREAQLQRLNSYGYLNDQKTLAHIPLARAMELLVTEQKK